VFAKVQWLILPPDSFTESGLPVVVKKTMSDSDQGPNCLASGFVPDIWSVSDILPLNVALVQAD
jgi:hypothetical protein